MRMLLVTLARKLKLIHPKGTIELDPPVPGGDGDWTVGNPSFILTETGVEGPFYPQRWDGVR